MKKILFILLAIILVSPSCRYVSGKRVRGNGSIKTESREINNFRAIEVSGAIKVLFKQDSVISAKVEADENLQEYVEVYMEKNSIIIEPASGYNLRPSKSIRVYISGPKIEYFQVSGASSITTENKITTEELAIDLSGASDADVEVKSPKISAELSGASSVFMSGETKDFRVDCSGASKAKCFELLTETTYVDLSGASDAQVFASIKIDAHISGAADLKYKGNATVTQDVSGAGSIKKVD
jgi:viroplasmin and RNaseH domain-containing protein